MRLLVTGASSFVGAHFCLAAARHHEVYGTFHSVPFQLSGVTPLRVDLRRVLDLERIRALDVDAVVHLACKIKARSLYDESSAEAATQINRAMMDAVLGLEKPVVYASSTVVHWAQQTPYGDIRKEDERRLAESGLPYAILRPSAPYARRLRSHQPGHKESFHTLAELVRSAPMVPVIGNGKYRRQPIHLDDFNRAMLHFLEHGMPDRAFDAGGADRPTMDEIIDTLARKMGRKVRKLHLPKFLFVKAASFNKDFDPTLLDAADEDELADPSELAAATGFQPRSFAEGAGCLVR
jgi:NADH dehydrogenase